MIVREQVPLAPLTTLGVGGPARYFAEAMTPADVAEALRFARERELSLFAMGGGSNLVVGDAGYPGLMLKIGLRGVERSNDGNFAIFRVAAGEDWNGFVALAVNAGCSGIECLSGIPGTVGGTPVQNVGAYGQEVAETIIEVDVIDRQSLQVDRLSKSDCGFGYRTSRFNATDRGRFIIVGVTFRLRHGGGPMLRYVDLQKHFAERTAAPTLAEVREAVLQIRRSKSMVLDPNDENRRSAGSFFKNPVVTQQAYEQLAARMEVRGKAMPSYPSGEDMRKLSAAWLVEQAGFHKGYSRGAAGISTRHTLAIVNRGGATAAEIVALKDEIQSRVQSEFGIQLTPEPVFVGF